MITSVHYWFHRLILWSPALQLTKGVLYQRWNSRPLADTFTDHIVSMSGVQGLFAGLQNPLWKTTWVPSLQTCHITPIPFTEIKQRNHAVDRYLGSRSMQVSGHFTTILQFRTTSLICPFSHSNCKLQEPLRNISLWLGLFPIESSTPDGPWCYRTASSILLLNINLEVMPLSLAMQGILAL